MTPTLVEIRGRHKAFHLKIAMLARPDPGISCPSASRRTSVPSSGISRPSAEDIAVWIDRQKAIPISVDAPKEPLFSIIEEADVATHKISIREIQVTVCKHFKVRVSDLLSNRRTRDLARPRQVAGYLAKMLTPLTYTAIGRHFGGRDHSTQLHAVRKVVLLMQADPLLKAKIEEIARELGGDLG